MAAPIVKAAITAGAAILSALSSFRQADATEELADLEAQREEAAANAEALQRERDAKDLQKKQIAAFSASGVVSSVGTPLLIQADTIKQSKEDILNIKQNSLFAQASLKGRGSIGAAKLRSQGTSTLLTAGSKIADMDFPSGSSPSMTTTPLGGSSPNFSTTV